MLWALEFWVSSQSDHVQEGCYSLAENICRSQRRCSLMWPSQKQHRERGSLQHFHIPHCGPQPDGHTDGGRGTVVPQGRNGQVIGQSGDLQGLGLSVLATACTWAANAILAVPWKVQIESLYTCHDHPYDLIRIPGLGATWQYEKPEDLFTTSDRTMQSFFQFTLRSASSSFCSGSTPGPHILALGVQL